MIYVRGRRATTTTVVDWNRTVSKYIIIRFSIIDFPILTSKSKRHRCSHAIRFAFRLGFIECACVHARSHRYNIATIYYILFNLINILQRKIYCHITLARSISKINGIFLVYSSSHPEEKKNTVGIIDIDIKTFKFHPTEYKLNRRLKRLFNVRKYTE